MNIKRELGNGVEAKRVEFFTFHLMTSECYVCGFIFIFLLGRYLIEDFEYE